MVSYGQRESIPTSAKKHPTFSLYCDTDGSIYSAKTGKARTLWMRPDGYLQLSIQKSSYLAHRIVAETFLNLSPDRPKINHLNGIKTDNRPSNLEWCTQRENIVHARDILGVKYSKTGKQNANASFMESHEVILANLHAKGFSINEISEIMGFCIPTIRRHLDEITR